MRTPIHNCDRTDIMKSLKRDLPILERVMSKPINDVLDKSDEIELNVTGRISGDQQKYFEITKEFMIYLN